MIAVGMEMLLRNIPNDYSYKKEYLDDHASEIEILILGNSHAHSSFNPEYFTRKAFNAGYVSQSLDCDYAILKKYLPELVHLEKVIIPISYSSLWAILAETAEWWRVKNYNIYFDLDFSHEIKDHSEVLGNRFNQNVERIHSYYLEEEPSIYSNSLGYGVNYSSKNPKDLVSTGVSSSIRHTIENLHSKNVGKQYVRNIHTLYAILNDCREKNISLLFVTTPTYSTYRERLHDEQLKRMTATMRHLTARYDHCQYINMLDDDRFDGEDFFDADHLNELGAKKLSIIVNKLITEETIDF